MKLVCSNIIKGLSAGMLIASLSGAAVAKRVNIVSMSTGFNNQTDTYSLIIKTDHELACGSDRVVFENQVGNSMPIEVMSSLISGSRSIEIGYARNYNEYFDACVGDNDSFVGFKYDVPYEDTLVTCASLKKDNPQATSGMYSIDPYGPGGGMDPFEAYCDMEFDGGGWTLVASFKDSTSVGLDSTVLLGSNQYYVNYHQIASYASKGVRFQLSEVVDVLVEKADLRSGFCSSSLDSHIEPNSMSSGKYLVWHHSEDNGCDATGEDYSMLRWIVDEQKFEVIGQHRTGFNAYYYDEHNVGGNGVGWQPFSSYGIYDSKEEYVHIYVK